MVAVIKLKHEPELRGAFACAHVHNNTVLVDRRPKWGANSGSAATALATGSSRATAPLSVASSARARPRWRNSRNSTAAGSLVIAIRCPVTAMCSNAQRHGPPGSWRSGQVCERQMGLLACRHGIHGDAFGPGYPLQSPVAALPAISASIPIASSRWRSLRAALARKAATSAHRLQTPCRAQPPKGAVPGTNKFSSDVMDHCATRAHCANPASGGVLHSAALRCGRDSE